MRIGYSRQYVSRVERASAGLPSANLVRQIDHALQASGGLIHLHQQAAAEQAARRQQISRESRTTSDPSVHGRAEVHREDGGTNRSRRGDHADGLQPGVRSAGGLSSSGVVQFNGDVQRRLFLASVAAAAVGAAAPEPLARLLDGFGAGLPSRVGISDVEAVEAAADAYMRFDLARSGDFAAHVARSSLRWSVQLLGQEMSDPTRERLASAVALLADRLGWSIYDSAVGGDAGRMLTFALDHAARGADRNLRAHVMLDLSTVVTDAGRPEDGVEILRAALGDERVSAAERANLHAVCARHCAAAGQQESGQRHVILAEEALARDDDVGGPSWAKQITYGPGHHDSALGLALFALDDTEGARRRLTAALRALDSGRTRTGLRCRIRLAALDLREGDTAAAEAEGLRVIENAAGVASARVRNDLNMLQSYATRYGSRGLADEVSRLLRS